MNMKTHKILLVLVSTGNTRKTDNVNRYRTNFYNIHIMWFCVKKRWCK